MAQSHTRKVCNRFYFPPDNCLQFTEQDTIVVIFCGTPRIFHNACVWLCGGDGACVDNRGSQGNC